MKEGLFRADFISSKHGKWNQNFQVGIQNLIRIPKSFLFSSQDLFKVRFAGFHTVSTFPGRKSLLRKDINHFNFQSLFFWRETLFCISIRILQNIFCEVLGKISDKESSPGKASPQGRGPYLFKEEIRPKEGPNFHHQGVIMICDITSDSNTFDYFLEEALVKRSVEPAEIALL